MPELTRPMHVGTIAARAGVPVDVDQWGWRRGFYPTSHHGRHVEGTAETFGQARADFDTAWREYLPECTDNDFDEYAASAPGQPGNM